MQEVIHLFIKLYYRNGLEKGTTIHTCDTAACVLGYAALKVPDTPEQLWYKLQQELGYHIADSIVGYSPGCRGGALRCVDPKHPLLDHNHITSINPTCIRFY